MAYLYRYSRQQQEQHLEPADDLVSIRTVDGYPLAAPSNLRRLPGKARDFVQRRLNSITGPPHAGVQVFRSKGGETAAVEESQRLLGDWVRTVNPVLQPEYGGLMAPTANVHVAFEPGTSTYEAARLLNDSGLDIKRLDRLDRDWFFCSVEDSRVLDAEGIAADLYSDPRVYSSYPELVSTRRPSQLASDQWHLYQANIDGFTVDAHVGARDAWNAGHRGEGVTIGLVDDGFDVRHEEFRSLTGIPKVVSPGTATQHGVIHGVQSTGRGHGIRCGGAACANGDHRVSGVAPGARVMPIALGASSLGLGSQFDYHAFKHAVDAGADVISCSWNPDSLPWALPAKIDSVLRFAASKGRNGRGCVVVFSAGNATANMDEDGYAAHPCVISVGACDGQGQQWPAGNTGSKLWCCAPGGYAEIPSPTGSISFGIHTTAPCDVSACGYDEMFIGTSAAAAVASGVAALILGARPALRAEQVKAVIRDTATKIPSPNAYVNGHSAQYGFGRVAAAAAIAAL